MNPENPDTIDLDNPEFLKVWELITHTNRSVFLTGKAGAGKSTFMRYITSNTSKRYVVLAPTGIAAVNAGGVTLHSFFRLPLRPVPPDDPDFSVRHLRERMKYPAELIKLIRELDLIIIDEISMVRADTIDLIDKILRFYTGKRREPFGGKQLLLVGDIFQLEPVAQTETRDILRQHYNNLFFFSAKAFSEFSVIPIELKKIYRQSDPVFISLLDRVRSGKPTKDDIKLLNSHVVSSAEQNNAEDEYVMTLATVRSTVDSINDQHLDQLKSPTVTYMGEISGNYPDTALPTPMELSIKVGAQVVFIKNDREHRWVNGTLGKVYSASDDFLEIELESGERHVVEPERWSNIRYEYDEKTKKINEIELGAYTQYPIRLAWALTIHKSQGLTFSNVIIDIGRGAFSGGQTYVALSRCRSLEGLSLRSTVNERDMFVNPAIIKFSGCFNSDSLVSSAIHEAHVKELFVKAAKRWNENDTSQAIENLVEASASDYQLNKPVVKRYLKQKLSIINQQREKLIDQEKTITELRNKLSVLASEYVAMGKLCLDKGEDPAPAIQNFDKALSIDPDCLDAMIGKARIYSWLGDAELAMTMAEKAVKSAPDNYDARMLMGDMAMAAGSLVTAMDNYLLAINICDSFPEPYSQIAEIYAKVGEDDEAEKYRIKASIAKRGGKRSQNLL